MLATDRSELAPTVVVRTRREAPDEVRHLLRYQISRVSIGNQDSGIGSQDSGMLKTNQCDVPWQTR